MLWSLGFHCGRAGLCCGHSSVWGAFFQQLGSHVFKITPEIYHWMTNNWIMLQVEFELL